MKQIMLAIVAVALIGCATVEKTTYNTVGIITTTVEAARKSFVDYENTGAVTQAQHDKVQAVYVKYQQAMQVANDAFTAYQASQQLNANSLQIAISAACAASGDVVALVSSFLPPDQAAKLQALPLPKGK